jgi:hypothetical protein
MVQGLILAGKKSLSWWIHQYPRTRRSGLMRFLLIRLVMVLTIANDGILCSSGAAAFQINQQDVRTLQPGVPIQRELASGEVHIYD